MGVGDHALHSTRWPGCHQVPAWLKPGTVFRRSTSGVLPGFSQAAERGSGRISCLQILTFTAPGFSLCDGHTKPDDVLHTSLLTSPPRGNRA